MVSRSRYVCVCKSLPNSRSPPVVDVKLLLLRLWELYTGHVFIVERSGIEVTLLI